MKYKKYILPVGIIIALIISLIAPKPGTFIKQYYAVDIFVIVIFLVYGYQHKFNNLKLNKKFIYTVLITALINLGLAPILSLGFSVMLLPVSISIGLIVMSCMPPTLSSGVVITEVAEGDAILALIITLILNILSFAVVPITLSLTIDNISSININPLYLFYKLIIIILLPFATGQILQKYLNVFKKSSFLKLTPTICVLLVIWVCISAASGTLYKIRFSSLILIIFSVISIHGVLLIINYFSGSLLKLEGFTKKAMVFVGSQKTLPLAVFVLATLSVNDATAIIVCILFHFFQLLIDSSIASFIVKREPVTTKK